MKNHPHQLAQMYLSLGSIPSGLSFSSHARPDWEGFCTVMTRR
nr:hypothetical protein [Bacillus velezensis]